MNKEPVTAPGSISLRDLVEGYMYQHHFKMFPVVEGGALLGCITTRMVKEVPQGEWGIRTVGEVASRCSPENTIGPGEDAIKALGVMSRTGNSRLMVVEDGRLVGIITLKDIMGLLSVKLDLGDEGR
jgi:CBS domain-containing protein